MTTLSCPRCGRPAEGSYFEGGALWAICDDCMDAERELARRARWEAEDRYFDFRYDGIDEEPSPAEAAA